MKTTAKRTTPVRKPSTPPRAAQGAIDLGTLQADAAAAAKRVKAAQRAFQKASEELTSATEANQRSRVALNQGVSAFKSSIEVTDLYAN